MIVGAGVPYSRLKPRSTKAHFESPVWNPMLTTNPLSGSTSHSTVLTVFAWRVSSTCKGLQVRDLFPWT